MIREGLTQLPRAAVTRGRVGISEAEFVGSVREKEQLLALYVKHKGSMKHIRNDLKFSRSRGREDLYRLLRILHDAEIEGKIELLDIHKKKIEKRRERSLFAAVGKFEMAESV